jgi:hypothetical protein
MHGPSSEWKKDNAVSIKVLIGKWFFLLYAIVYAGFILINVASPEFMTIDIGNLNIAIIYGFGLILFAMLLAIAYNSISTHAESVLNDEDEMESNGKDGCGS